MSAFWAVVTFFNNLWEAVKMILSTLAAQRKAERSEDLTESDKAVDAAKAAKTAEEAYAAQDRIVDNQP